MRENEDLGVFGFRGGGERGRGWGRVGGRVEQ